MEQITKYVAKDKSEHTDIDACLRRDADYDSFMKIIDGLPPRPPCCEFDNGHGYIQHDATRFMRLRSEICEFSKRYTDHKWLQDTIDKGLEVHDSWAGRIIGECCPDFVYRLGWHRVSCTDKQFREWGQPYFANNPQEARSIVRIN